MKSHIYLILSLLIFVSAYPSLASEKEEWVWYEKIGYITYFKEPIDSIKRNKNYLDSLIVQHQRWYNRGWNGDGRIQLSYANLRGASFNEANLFAGDFSFADFSNSRIMGSNLNKARFHGANMTQVWFYMTTLSETNFMYSNLSGSDLSSVDLSRASMWYANLSESNLRGTNLSKTQLNGADLSASIFQPDSLPPINSIAFSRGLNSLRFENDPSAIIKLRTDFNDAGYRRQAKQVNTSLKRCEARWYETILFDWTCEWGSNWFRPLKILFFTFVLFFVFYMFYIIRYTYPASYLLTDKEGLRKEILLRRTPSDPAWEKGLRLNRLSQRFWIALGFSLNSTMRIGFREINLANWLRMFLEPEFEFRSRGWPRILSAAQSLISVYLIALAIYSYFSGKPFDY